MANEKFDTSLLSPGVLGAFNRDDFKQFGITPDKLEQIPPETLPYTRFGLDNRNQGIASLPPLGGKTIGGFTTWDKNIPGSSFIAIGPDSQSTPGHEIEHALEKQSGRDINSEWNKLVRQGKTQSTFNPADDRQAVVSRLLDHSDYLYKNWGVDPSSSYFGKDAKQTYGNTYGYLLNEQLASIVPTELKLNKKFTDDPYVRENILTTPAQRETFEALTGLRQARLDSKDLPPYTRQPENRKPAPEPKPVKKTEPGMLESLRNKLGFKAGGSIVKPIKGGSKSI
jgi:hypothetical protein